MGFAQKQHTQSGLADTAADGAGQFAFQQHSVIFQTSAVITAGFSQLLIQCERINTDTHGRDFDGVIHNGVIEQFFIYPAIIGESLGLTTLETIIVVLLGGILAGIPGMIFALPAASVIKYLVPQIYRCWR